MWEQHAKRPFDAVCNIEPDLLPVPDLQVSKKPQFHLLSIGLSHVQLQVQDHLRTIVNKFSHFAIITKVNVVCFQRKT